MRKIIRTWSPGHGDGITLKADLMFSSCQEDKPITHKGNKSIILSLHCMSKGVHQWMSIQDRFI